MGQQPAKFYKLYPGQPNNANGDQDYGELFRMEPGMISTMIVFVSLFARCLVMKSNKLQAPLADHFSHADYQSDLCCTQGGYHDTCSFW
ncbi:MAG: hypothetical protein IPI30_21745 [Saprospiraceae bacterium]|nr:hypothetical protein [Candidatus Vicinibacter affinis]